VVADWLPQWVSRSRERTPPSASPPPPLQLQGRKRTSVHSFYGGGAPPLFPIRSDWPSIATMSTKHIRTAADLVRFGASLRIDCSHCGAARTMAGGEVVKAGGAEGLAGLRARLRCARCGAKGANVAVLPPV
jgi:hypothetical protein